MPVTGISFSVGTPLALVEEDHGHGVAMALAKQLVLFLRRSGSQAQFSSALRRQEKEPAKLRYISAFVLEHLDEALPVERIAAGMVPRIPRRAKLGITWRRYPSKCTRHRRLCW
jgi:transcriptional regulator GlxA family with amidase domain